MKHVPKPLHTSATHPPNVIAFGELLWDLLPSGPTLGGAPSNFAYRMHTLGSKSYLVSRTGQDELGRRALIQLRSFGMPLDGLQVDPNQPTGTVEVTLDASNNPDYYILPQVAYDHIQPSEALEELAVRANALYYGSLAQRTETSTQTLEWLIQITPANCLKICDANLRKDCFSRESLSFCLRHADILKISDEEMGVISDWFGNGHSQPVELGQQLCRDWGLKCCLITLGSKGALAIRPDGSPIYQPGFRIHLKDPVGAGDAFTAGFASQWLEGKPLADCCRTGCGLGAMVAGQSGATEWIDRTNLDGFIGQHHADQIDARWESFILSN